jgi:hypothetical protein
MRTECYHEEHEGHEGWWGFVRKSERTPGEIWNPNILRGEPERGRARTPFRAEHAGGREDLNLDPADESRKKAQDAQEKHIAETKTRTRWVKTTVSATSSSSVPFVPLCGSTALSGFGRFIHLRYLCELQFNPSVAESGPSSSS